MKSLMRLSILDHLLVAKRGNKHQQLRGALAIQQAVLSTTRQIKLKKQKMRSKFQEQLPRIWWRVSWYLLVLIRAASTLCRISMIKWVLTVIWARKRTSVRIRLRKCHSKWCHSRIKVNYKQRTQAKSKSQTRKMTIVRKALKNAKSYSLQHLRKLKSLLEAARRSKNHLSET